MEKFCTPRRHHGAALAAGFWLLFALGDVSSAQVIPGPNVSIVASDPYSQKQVEMDAAANPLNPNHIFAGYIDYQTVWDAENPQRVTSAGRCGYSFSTNGGKTWRNRLIEVAANVDMCGDPVVAWDVNGHAFYFGLIRLTNGNTTMMVWRFTDPDDGTGALIPVDEVQVDAGTAGAQLDKNSLIYQPDAAPGAGPNAPGTLYACYTSFQGGAQNNIKVVCAISRDGGDTWSLPNQGKYNANINSNNGAAAAPAPNASIYLFWRAFLGDENGYYFVKVSPNGNATSPMRVPMGPSGFHPYDGVTRSDLARSLAFPQVASDGNQQVLLTFQAYADPTTGVMTPSSSIAALRIFGLYSSDGGANWTLPFIIDNGPHRNAHQFMPKAAYAGGVWSVTFYDGRNQGCADPADQPDWTTAIGECGVGRALSPDAAVSQYFPSGRDRRFDIRVAQSLDPRQFNGSTQVTRYETRAGTQQIVQRDPRCAPNCPALNFPFLSVGAGGASAWMGDYVAHMAKVPFLRNTNTALPAWRYTQPGDPTTTLAFWADFRHVAFPLDASGQPKIDAVITVGGQAVSAWTQFIPASVSANACVNPESRDVDVKFSEIITGGLSAGVKSTALQSGIPPEFTVNVQNLSGRDTFLRLEIVDGASTAPAVASEDWSTVQSPPASGAPLPDSNVLDVKILKNSSVTETIHYRLRLASVPAAPVLVRIFEVSGRQANGSACEPGNVSCVLPGGSPVAGGLSTSVTYNVSATSGAIDAAHGVLLTAPLVSLSQRTGKSFKYRSQPSNELLDNDLLDNDLLDNDLLDNELLDNELLDNDLLDNDLLDNSLIEDQQVLWTVTGAGALTTAATALGNVANGRELLESGWAFQLLIYQTQLNARAFTDAGKCVQLQVPVDVVLSNIAVKGHQGNYQVSNDLLDNDLLDNDLLDNDLLDNSPIGDQLSNASFAVDSGETVHIALRAFKPPSSTLQFNPTDDDEIGEAVIGQADNPDGSAVAAFFDTTPPNITFTLSPSPNAAGWNNTPVTVTWTVRDAQSGIVSKTGCGSVTLADDTAGTTLTCTAVNGAGLPNAPSVTIKIDKAPPVMTVGATTSVGAYTAGTWTNKDVTVTFSCTDVLSQVASGPTNSPTVFATETSTGSVSSTCTDKAGNTASPLSFGLVKVDKTPPTAAITRPISDASYFLTPPVNSNYSCSDNVGGSGVATCSGPVANGVQFNTGAPGANTFTVTATDRAGNTANRSVTYFIVSYSFLLSSVKSPSAIGNAVPLTWQLKDVTGAIISRLNTLLTLKSYFSSKSTNPNCATNKTLGTPAQIYSPATGATGGSDYRFITSATSYRFNWDTTVRPAGGPGCYTLVWQLDDHPDVPGVSFVPNPLRMKTIELK